LFQGPDEQHVSAVAREWELPGQGLASSPLSATHVAQTTIAFFTELLYTVYLYSILEDRMSAGVALLHFEFCGSGTDMPRPVLTELQKAYIGYCVAHAKFEILSNISISNIDREVKSYDELFVCDPRTTPLRVRWRSA
jgi:hypothetical protein